MNTKFVKQIESINDAAKHFGLSGFHVDVRIHGSIQAARVIIFFDKLSQKEDINRVLCCYKDEEDTIEFRKFEKDEDGTLFYTFTLNKE